HSALFERLLLTVTEGLDLTATTLIIIFTRRDDPLTCRFNHFYHLTVAEFFIRFNHFEFYLFIFQYILDKDGITINFHHTEPLVCIVQNCTCIIFILNGLCHLYPSYISISYQLKPSSISRMNLIGSSAI